MEKTIGMRIKECRLALGMTQEMPEELRKVAMEQVKVLNGLSK